MNGWCQGALIHPEDLEGQCIDPTFCFESNERLLILSQSCDLLHDDFNAEPYFEALRICPLKDPVNKGFEGGKHPRRLEIELPLRDVEHGWAANINDRFRFDRTITKTLQLSGEVVPPDMMRVIVAWVIARYNRVAFPDSYDKRWKKKKSVLENLIKQLRQGADLYIHLDPRHDELQDGQDYYVEIILLMEEADYQNTAALNTHKLALTGIAKILNKCEGIQVPSQPVIQTPTDITLEEIRQLTRWDYSYLSFRDPDNTTPPHPSTH